ncbi:GNAT family N-acetyltransferase [Streptosporangium sp. NPDC006930]|uniref:GNAT family N-acetyltransferase n=1 Tax=unclassified Streptosporangium TaxID=2632669 RepID=UPI00343223B2
MTDLPLTIHPATAADADALGEIHADSWAVAYESFFGPEFFAEAVGRRRTKWGAVVASGQDTILLAALNGRPLAFSYFGNSPEHPGAAEIFGFYGHPDGWGSGIAAALMTATVERLRAEGFPRVHLWTLRDTPQSRRFYAKTGFAESGAERRHDFGDGNLIDEVEYELTL